MADADYFQNPPPRRTAALALLEHDGQYVIISRSYWTEVSRWGLPGGSAAPNEHPRRAMSRLLAEKLGLRLTPQALIAVDYSPPMPGHCTEGLNFVYHVPLPTRAEISVVDNSGYTEARWVTAEEAKDLAVDHELWRINECLTALRGGFTADLLKGLPFPSPHSR
ncbi:NUDIX domain-containing protein [Nonomuraea sp. NPDC001636]|uniref:NUDIX domain-containing protein n=1 Tax=Nonomuraea sp. NPDC001636 TaxID=3154391 RepID=UPI0033307C3F